MSKISLEYFQQENVVWLARDLVGKKLCTQIDGHFTSGIITETEAYRSWNDKACHAHLNRRTKRTEIMFAEGGHAYVYLCYGIHHLFNIVTNTEGNAEAVLVRAIEPLEGVDIMKQRRGREKLDKSLSSGPGTLSQALGIKTGHYGDKLDGERIWLEQYLTPSDKDIATSTRIGVDYAEEDALLPWRFYLKTSKFVSKR